MDFYETRDVPHVAQGDIFDTLPFDLVTVLGPGFEAAGARKRESSTEPTLASVRIEAPGVLLHYTCGMTAQPPGTEGYAHEHRLVAPIVGLSKLNQSSR